MLCQGLSPQIASSLFVRRSGWLHSVCFPCFFAEIICRISLIPVSPTASWRRALGTRDNERLRRAYGRREATASRPSSCLSASPRSKEMTPEDCRYTSEISNFCYFFFFYLSASFSFSHLWIFVGEENQFTNRSLAKGAIKTAHSAEARAAVSKLLILLSNCMLLGMQVLIFSYLLTLPSGKPT